MTVRPPQNFRQSDLGANGFNVLEYELMSEQASALGRTGLAAEAALKRLKQSEAPDRITHERLVDDAAQTVWALFIQREICGLRNNREVIDRSGIPGEVLARLGARPRHPVD
ncbi:DUF6665 family protein [Neorhizobium sp. NPDC001467]|uniref:DUF6665 family protein n=1 Tax=Neorhizobium sp. NPDC001467 TaxID=3390595 RepID=UPI003D08FD22